MYVKHNVRRPKIHKDIKNRDLSGIVRAKEIPDLYSGNENEKIKRQNNRDVALKSRRGISKK
jgi:hypothetical protein